MVCGKTVLVGPFSRIVSPILFSNEVAHLAMVSDGRNDLKFSIFSAHRKRRAHPFLFRIYRYMPLRVVVRIQS
jgi:hypothetical protein